MKIIAGIILGIIFLSSCNSDKPKESGIKTNDNKTTVVDSTLIELTLCDCLDSLAQNKEWCELNYPNPLTIDQQFECSGDSSLLDTISAKVKDSIRNDYENNLSLEIKEIEEEKVDPISEECKQFLEKYAEAIKDFKYLTDKVEKNPDDIGLKISYASQSEDMNSWGSKPLMFQCSQSESFKTQVEILNVKKDKLIEN